MFHSDQPVIYKCNHFYPTILEEHSKCNNTHGDVSRLSQSSTFYFPFIHLQLAFDSSQGLLIPEPIREIMSARQNYTLDGSITGYHVHKDSHHGLCNIDNPPTSMERNRKKSMHIRGDLQTSTQTVTQNKNQGPRCCEAPPIFYFLALKYLGHFCL